MKVTVGFDTVRLVVPCGDGQLLVAQLIDQAVARYCKTVGKGESSADSSCVVVHHLKSADGGILDPDDRLCDVVDDREQLTAFYEVHDCHDGQRQNGGDGTSSGGTTSPDAYHKPTRNGFDAALLKAELKEVVLLTPEHLARDNVDKKAMKSPYADTAYVRATRSPSSLSTDPPHTSSTHDDNDVVNATDATGTAAVIGRDVVDGDNDEESLGVFVRAPARKSLGNNAALLGWLDAQERLQNRLDSNEDREEPVGSCNKVETSEPFAGCRSAAATTQQSIGNCRNEPAEIITMVELENPGGPLGIHVMPAVDDPCRSGGLSVHNIEPYSLIDRDGRIQPDDCIIEVNGHALVDLDFTRAQQVFKNALRSSVIRLRVIRPLSTSPTIPTATDAQPSNSTNVTDRVNNLRNCQQPSPDTGDQNAVTSVIKIPPAVPPRNASTTLSAAKNKFTQISSTRLIGKVINIELTKGALGLGFSITTRDNPAGGENPVYIKKILPQGAAVADGRLQSGDRLLRVNDVDMSGQSQDDIVSLLRNVDVGSVARLTVSRQTSDDHAEEQSISHSSDSVDSARGVRISTAALSGEAKEKQSNNGASSPVLRCLTTKTDVNDNPVVDGNLELIELSVGVGEDESETSSGLGISIKGMSSGREDLGLFIKRIIEGRAAAKDGRLRVNDRLVRLNGVSLIGRSNSQTMSTLREALRRRGTVPGYIDVVVARQTTFQPTLTHCCSSDVLCDTPPSTPHADTSSGNATHGGVTTETTKGVSRNVSYQLANTDSFATDNSGLSTPRTGDVKPLFAIKAPTINGRHADTVLIETDESRPSTLQSRRDCKIRDCKMTVSGDADSRSSVDATTIRPSSLSTSHDVTVESCDVSPTDAEAENAFSREAVGRQSMSEKRKAYMDARLLNFYQHAKSAKGVNDCAMKKCMSVESLKPAVNLAVDIDVSEAVGNQIHRSCSLESVRVASPRDVTGDDDVIGGQVLLPTGVRRTRGFNESFRAAVDRSYNNRQTASRGIHSAIPRTSLPNGDPYADRKNGRKQKGLLKTFGEVFRIGKTRTSLDATERAQLAASRHHEFHAASSTHNVGHSPAKSDVTTGQNCDKFTDNMSAGSDISSQSQADDRFQRISRDLSLSNGIPTRDGSGRQQNQMQFPVSNGYSTATDSLRSSRQEPVPQSVSSSAASSSSYSRSAPRSRDLQPASRPTARVPPPAESQTAVRNDVHRRHQAAGSTKPYNNGEPTAACRPTSDWSHSSVGNDQPATANGAYESCIAAITRQQVDSFMARCHRSHPTAAAARRNIRQNPTVV